MSDIPINIPLSVPGGFGFLHFLLVITFIIHILFIAMMIGGTYWSVLFVLIGRSDPFYKRLAREILDTVTINKSLAVVLGVAPLLLISLIYTIYWYPATQITYPFFLSVVWLVIVAFLAMYVYKYTWDTLGNRLPLFHLCFGLLGLGIFTLVPFIFLTNINLMLFPFRWSHVNGFFDALVLQNVFQRYAHFMVAVFATIGFFAAAYFWFRGRHSDDPFYARATSMGLKWALGATLLQAIFGPVNFYSLQVGSYSTRLLVLVLVGSGLAMLVCIVLILAIQNPSGGIIISAAVLLAIIAVVMSFVRDTVRVNLLRGPNEIAQRSTEEYQTSLGEFLKTYAPPGEEHAGQAETGEQVFKQHCSSCHAPNEVLVGPPLTYMVGKYKSDPQTMIQFVLNPRKVNPNLPSMPKPAVTADQVHEVVEYVLSEQWKQPQQESTGTGKVTTGPEQKEAATTETGPTGEDLFKQNCSPCHAYDHVVVGPPEQYMIKKYTGNEDQMINFVLNPRKVNPNLPQMPKPPVDKEQATKIVEYILSQGKKDVQ